MKQPILPDAANGSSTDHLLPVIDFLKAQGNAPAGPDKFTFNRDGLGVYAFQQPVDVEQLRAHFDFPPSIHLSADGLHDSRHFVRVQQATPLLARRFSFEL
ncbi:hypothetical protein [Solirubrum puertoriconensis]|uniref:Uncharacterized protein n=1 Tax=Solirubrum puertoriconensis TaxID=1751427 RepID=A0A9X0L5W9_SOLP1|nr:hypothetical protein [Solirubrum puertoriconensis]KUG09211.1 hypothetical protein ASU33_20835 [Solirubrum puertoriconensis]